MKILQLSATLFCFLISNLLMQSQSVKILAIFPFAGPSQYINVLPYLKALATRGHDLTVINAFPQKQPVPNFRDILVMEVHNIYKDILKSAIEHKNAWQELNFKMDFCNNVTRKVLENHEVQILIKSPKAHFDLIIIETLRTDPLFGLAQHFNATLIGFNVHGTDWIIDEHVGNTSPISYIPLVTSSFTDRMNYWQRLQNLAEKSLSFIHYRLVHFPKQVALYHEHFPNAKIPLEELRKQFSLMLLNQHFSLSFPRPYVPNMIEVGGLHISHKTAPLPADIAEFVESAKDGVIYFSMGSNFLSKDLPENTRKIILQVFGSLKQKVLWKFEDDQLPGKPANVFIQKWFPQPDILAHPNVKLFITQSGLLSSIEAIHHGKPVLGLPLYFDQFLNIERAKHAGFGLGLNVGNLNAPDFKSTIERLLTEPSFSQVATEMSQRFHDQPMKPLETAIWWTEYVIRHKGAKHMRVAAQDLSFVAYHSLDTAVVLFGGLGVILLLIIYVLSKLICSVVRLLTKPQKKKQKNH